MLYRSRHFMPRYSYLCSKTRENTIVKKINQRATFTGTNGLERRQRRTNKVSAQFVVCGQYGQKKLLNDIKGFF